MKAPRPRRNKDLQLAGQVARSLFRNGFKERAHRLVLVDETGRDLGGLCEAAVRTRIFTALMERNKHK